MFLTPNQSGLVQYTIVQAGILQYQLVCIRLGEGFRTDGVGHELGIIQIAVSYTHLVIEICLFHFSVLFGHGHNNAKILNPITVC